MGAFRYSSTGEFLDREAWQEAQLAKGDCGSVLALAERLIKNANGKPSSELSERLVKGIDRVMDGRALAWAMKLRGMCIDAQGNMQEALDCYQKALALDPKVGVKRRAEQIRKNLGKLGS